MIRSKTLLYVKLVLLNLLLMLIILTFILTLNGRNLTTITAMFTSADLSNYTEISGIVNVATSNISSIEIDIEGGDIEVFGYSSEGICILYDSENSIKCVYIVENSTLKIKLDDSSFDADMLENDLDIYIPNGLLHQLSVETTTGDIKVYSYGNKLDAETVSGNIYMADGYQENYIKTATGDISIYPQMDFIDNININTVSGNCYIFSSELNCTTNFSSITGKFDDYCDCDVDDDTFDFKISFSSISGDLIIGE